VLVNDDHNIRVCEHRWFMCFVLCVSQCHW